MNPSCASTFGYDFQVTLVHAKVMLLLAAVALVWFAPLVWLMRVADSEIRAAQSLHVDLPPKAAREDEGWAERGKLLLVESSEAREAEYAEQDTDRMPQAA